MQKKSKMRSLSLPSMEEEKKEGEAGTPLDENCIERTIFCMAKKRLIPPPNKRFFHSLDL